MSFNVVSSQLNNRCYDIGVMTQFCGPTENYVIDVITFTKKKIPRSLRLHHIRGEFYQDTKVPDFINDNLRICCQIPIFCQKNVKMQIYEDSNLRHNLTKVLFLF